MVEKTLTINMERLMDTIEQSANIGRLPGGGICRLTLTNEDKQMRDLFTEWMNSSGLKVRVDDFGNIYGRMEGKKRDAEAVLIGSHLDTQPEGGRYDGILGVLTGLEVLRTIHENEIVLDRPVELVCFTNEEGSRFEPAMLGSGGLAGAFDKEYIYHIKDRSGRTFIDELVRIGYLGSEENRAKNIHSYIELHIEQGPILERENLDVGIVTGIQGMNWIEVKVTGETNHAGTTPMNMRKDALRTAVRIIDKVQELTQNMDGGALITVGRMSLLPNSINCIPGEVVFSIDIRHPEDEIRKNIVKRIEQTIQQIVNQDQTLVEYQTIMDISTTHFSEKLIKLISEGANKLGYTSKKMMSGAGHDAKFMSHIAPTAMIFVPCAGGKSHCQEEYTTGESIEKGARLLLYVVNQLAGNI
ncbi:N-carbamoyl-L-amino acid hydrolase [Geobacillus sp. 12AMOR1]|nr:N-carbamoyl-L-amino acid hydrolase [Geobacillus sp. 12AMOR1]